jgi:hypothetical protein
MKFLLKRYDSYFTKKGKNTYRILFTIRDTKVYVLYVRHSAQAPLSVDDLEDLEN